MNIVLIGFMGSGKSTIAKHLHHLLGFSLIEMDELVFQKTNSKNMDEVFEKGGEMLLREVEIAIAKEYALRNHLVISTGGGIVLNKISLDYFKDNGGKVFFLNSSFETIAQRLEGDVSRPLFKQLAIAKKIYEFRLPLYASYADTTIDVDFQSPDQIAQKIKEKVLANGL